MLGELARFPTGVIESAVAKLGRRQRGDGVAGPGLVPVRASHARVVGYAIPVQMSIDPGDPHGRRDNAEWWRHIEQQPALPRVIVAQDISSDPAHGVVCGRLSAHIYSALRCAGFLTNGFVRDAGTLASLDFALFAKGRSARHGNPHVVRFGAPAEIFGARVHPGDIIAADEDGLVAFPSSWLANVIEEAHALESKQAPVYEHLRSGKADAASIAKALQPKL